MAQQGYRSLITVLTKRMAEDLTEYLHEQGIRVRYMHSDIDTIERIEIIRDLRLGAFDALVGINLLREGLDIPECALVAILDADKEGFLRSETSLVQTIGRAARNIDGRVILYADAVTGSMERAMAETSRRREKQEAYNTATASRRKACARASATFLTSVYERDHVLISTGEAGAGGEFEDSRHHRAQFRGGDRRPGNPHARRRRRSRLRGSGADARRDQAAARDRTRRGRRSDREIPGRSRPGRTACGTRRRKGAGHGKVHKPGLDEMGIALYHEVAPHRPGGVQKREAPRKPNLDEMGPGHRIRPRQIVRRSIRTGPRSTLGRPGMRGGWKPRGR